MPKIKIKVLAPGGPVEDAPESYYTSAEVSQEDADRLVDVGHAEYETEPVQAKKTTTRGSQQVETATAQAPEKRDEVDYDSYTVVELREQATGREIKTTGLNKADLIKELKKADRKK